MVATEPPITNAGAAWDEFVGDELADDRAALEYSVAMARVAATTALAAAFERARVANRMSKAQVARRIFKKPSAISRLFGGDGINPTCGTLAEMAVGTNTRVRIIVEPNLEGLAPLEVIAKV
jgi:hypothetical protein